MSKKLFLIFGLLALIAIGHFIYKNYFPKKEIHYHAGFKVYVDGKLQDFSLAKYMTIKPCGEEGKKSAEDEQLEKAHLHDGVGDVVHVEAENAKWSDLFKNINYKIDSSKIIMSYVDGKKVENILDYPIKAYDSFVVFIGDSPNLKDLLKQAVSKEHIKEVEKSSESC